MPCFRTYQSNVFYLQVWINLNLVNAPMHTENLKVPADALHYHSIQYATMCFASYRQSIIHEHTRLVHFKHSLALHKVFICIHVLFFSLNTEIPTILKSN